MIEQIIWRSNSRYWPWAWCRILSGPPGGRKIEVVYTPGHTVECSTFFGKGYADNVAQSDGNALAEDDDDDDGMDYVLF